MANISNGLKKRYSIKGYNLFVAITFFVLGALYIALGVPLFEGKVAPNCGYGFRVQKTLANEDIWYRTNEYFGEQMIIAGLVLISIAILFLFLCNRVKPLWLTLLLTIVPIIPLLMAIIRTIMFLQRL